MKVIKRSDIIRALRTEPLEAGNWIAWGFKWEDYLTPASELERCTVCAVGAVLRHCTDMTANDITHCGFNLIIDNRYLANQDVYNTWGGKESGYGIG